jgi:glycosyltransferase involved in cell wall biosynthesis
VSLRTAIRQWLGPLTLAAAARQLQPVIARLQPNLVHAMRIPYEGMLAARSVAHSDRLLISVWGNDFTLHAPSTPLMRWNTRQALQRADALHADCQRDIRLAHAEGFDTSKPYIVLPGAGGVQKEIFYPPETPVASPVVINPRGFRAYINNESFFRAVPIVLKSYPEAAFLCPAMENEPQAWRWVEQLGISKNVRLLPNQTRAQMADLFRQARVAVSPSLHDGTPNTLLEAMACGCLPVAGDLESLREWIVPDENGLLIDPSNPEDIAQAIIQGLKQDELQHRAREINLELISQRADHPLVMQAALDFYQRLISA